MKLKTLLAVIVLAYTAAAAHATTTYSTVGNTTYGSDGTTYSHVGNTTYGSDGSTANTVGNTTYINDADGSSHTCSLVGNTSYCN